MTKPWHPWVIRGGKRPKGNLVGQWDRHRWPMPGQKRRRRGWRPSLRELSLMVMIGLMSGLAVSQFLLKGGAEAAPLPSSRNERQSADPYRESRRSREIQEEQERAPPPGGREDRVERPDQGAGDIVRAQPAFVRVIDGDTFDYRGDRIRVADIDTPERDGRCPHETRLAAQAAGRMRALLAAGAFELHPSPDGRDEDAHGRKLRIVTRGGRSLGDQLVAEGLARTWSGRREPWC
jgi:micrococcal nuclease